MILFYLYIPRLRCIGPKIEGTRTWGWISYDHIPKQLRWFANRKHGFLMGRKPKNYAKEKNALERGIHLSYTGIGRLYGVASFEYWVFGNLRLACGGDLWEGNTFALLNSIRATQKTGNMFETLCNLKYRTNLSDMFKLSYGLQILRQIPTSEHRS